MQNDKLLKYPQLNKDIITIGNSNSMYNRGNNLNRSYLTYIELIDSYSELNEDQKQKLAKKFHSLYSDYALKNACVLNPMVTGPSKFPTRQNQKRIYSERNAWEKVETFMNKYPQIFNPKKDYDKCARERNNQREVVFKCDDYKIVKYTLKTGEERVGFDFVLRIQRQLQVALKSRGFRWNANVNLWGGKIGNYEKHKEWCETLSTNYSKYIN